jgi:flavin-dependent dehydrogenase
VAARVATGLGRERNPKRPLGVAVRSRYRLAQPPKDPTQTEWMESHLDLWDGPPGQGRLMPGYGWVFPEAGGTVNVGVGSVSSNGQVKAINHRELLSKWVATLEDRWSISPATQVDGPRGAGLPMAFNRQPLYGRGLLLVGDAAGLVSPFDGEGIGQAMESGRVAAECVAQALACATEGGRERALHAYPARMKQSLGGYFQLGRGFVKLIEQPRIMRLCTDLGLPRPTLMRLVNKLISNLYEVRGGDWTDRLIATAARLAPAA